MTRVCAYSRTPGFNEHSAKTGFLERWSPHKPTTAWTATTSAAAGLSKEQGLERGNFWSPTSPRWILLHCRGENLDLAGSRGKKYIATSPSWHSVLPAWFAASLILVFGWQHAVHASRDGPGPSRLLVLSWMCAQAQVRPETTETKVSAWIMWAARDHVDGGHCAGPARQLASSLCRREQQAIARTHRRKPASAAGDRLACPQLQLLQLAGPREPVRKIASTSKLPAPLLPVRCPKCCGVRAEARSSVNRYVCARATNHRR
jgi:hypothetical protein